MAKALNRSRIRDTKFTLVLCAVIMALTQPLSPLRMDAPIHELLDFSGYFFIGICVVGRVYCTAFLGGHKNQALITHGPFSVCRNPLYFCSFLGACGIALMSNHVTILCLIPAVFLIVFTSVIKREETYLLEKFGEEYAAYCRITPRLIPNFRLYHAPETLEFYPKFLLKGAKDGLTWFMAFPLIELVEYLHSSGIMHPLMIIP